MKNPWLTLTGAVRVGWMVMRAPGGAWGSYWAWRQTTAFGPGDVAAGRKLKSAAEYCRWVSLMRRIEKGRHD